MGARTGYRPGTFCWVDLSTPDAGAARAFYGELLGWESDGPIARLGGAAVAAIAEAPGHRPVWTSYVATDDAAATADRAAALGGTVIEGAFPVGDAGRLALLADPAGAPIGVWEAGAHHGAQVVNEPGALTWNDLQTPDVPAVQGFYEELFGWRVSEIPESGGRYFRVDGPEGVNGGMMPSPAPEPPPHWNAYFAVDSLDSAVARVRELGGATLTDPLPVPGGAFVAVRDAQGATFSLFAGRLDD